MRIAFLILLTAGSLLADFHWKCDPKDGKFTVRLCATCKMFYCWDGQIFSEEDGYTPPPGYVLAYWEEVHRRSQQIRADIERKNKEMQQKFENSVRETERLNQDRGQAHKEFMDQLNGRVTATRATPRNVVIDSPGPAISEPAIAPSSRAKVSEVQIGMDRAHVEAILGKPHSSISIPQENGLIETLSYALEDHGAVRVRIERGKVVSVNVSE